MLLYFKDIMNVTKKLWINISIWATGHLPLPWPNINLKLLSIDCCWVRGGVGEQLPRYWYWSEVTIYRPNFSVTFIKSLNQISIKPCLICDYCFWGQTLHWNCKVKIIKQQSTISFEFLAPESNRLIIRPLHLQLPVKETWKKILFSFGGGGRVGEGWGGGGGGWERGGGAGGGGGWERGVGWG